MQQSLAYICESFMLLSCLSLIIGWRQARHRRMVAHKRWMLTSVFLAAGFFLTYACKTVFVGDTIFAGPEALRQPYQVFLQLHSILATVAAVLGGVTLRFGLKRMSGRHGKIGKWTAATWIVTTVSGLAVFAVLYVIYPSNQTANVVQTWIGQ